MQLYTPRIKTWHSSLMQMHRGPLMLSCKQLLFHMTWKGSPDLLSTLNGGKVNPVQIAKIIIILICNGITFLPFIVFASQYRILRVRYNILIHCEHVKFIYMNCELWCEVVVKLKPEKTSGFYRSPYLCDTGAGLSQLS